VLRTKLVTRGACLASLFVTTDLCCPRFPETHFGLLLFCWLTVDGDALNRTCCMTQKLDISTYWVASDVSDVGPGWRRLYVYGGWWDWLSVRATVVCPNEPTLTEWKRRESSKSRRELERPDELVFTADNTLRPTNRPTLPLFQRLPGIPGITAPAHINPPWRKWSNQSYTEVILKFLQTKYVSSLLATMIFRIDGKLRLATKW